MDRLGEGFLAAGEGHPPGAADLGERRAELLRALGRLPELAGRSVRLTPLSGGMTNRNYLVEAEGRPDRLVVRLAGFDTYLLGISREVEHAATVAAAGVGVGPEVVAFLRPEGYLVTRFIDGRPVTPTEVRRPETLRRLADSLRRFHEGPPIPGLFVPLRIVEVYRALAAARGVPIPAAYGLAQAVARRIELALITNPAELRPCHNELSCGNFIDDGERIRIVDWEFAGMGDPYFDLGDVVANHDLDPEAAAILLEAYLGASPSAQARARLALMAIVADFRTAMAAVLRGALRPEDPAPRQLASERLERIVAAAERPAFHRALREAAGD